jgi:hypothetical protein
MGCGNPHLFTIVVNGPAKDNDVIDLNPQSFASIWKLDSTTKYCRKRSRVPAKRIISSWDFRQEYQFLLLRSSSRIGVLKALGDGY